MDYINSETAEVLEFQTVLSLTESEAQEGDTVGIYFPVFEDELPAFTQAQVATISEPQLVEGRWCYKWNLRDKTLAELQQDSVAIQAELTQVLDTHLDTVAQQRLYNDRFTCSLRAGYPGPFQAEGQTFAIWMDNCNITAYQIMAEVKQGSRPIPTGAELIAEMPIIEWSASPI